MTPLLAHQGFATPGNWWSPDPATILPPVVALVLLTALVARAERRRASPAGRDRLRSAAFALGGVAGVAAVMSPLHELADALFAAHMVQHLLLVTPAAPLLVVGAPAITGRPRPTGGLPLWALPAMSALLVVTFTLWHAPALYGAALGNVAIHGLEHTSMFLAALLHWAAVASAVSRRHEVAATGSIIVSGLPAVALGALLALSPRPWYPEHGHGAAAWGVDPLADQQLGGMIMWVVGGTANLAVALVLVFRFLAGSEGDRRHHAAPPVPLR